MTGTAWPASVKLQEFEIRPDENKARSESIFTRQGQTVSLAGGTADRWEGMLTTVPLDFTAAKVFMGWLVTVGLYGQFTIGDPLYTGVASGVTTGLVQGAGQSGSSLIVDGVGAGAQFLAGEYFQVRDEYKILKSNATANGSGVVTLSFWPALRVSPADDDPVTFNTPKLVLELTSMPAKAPTRDRLHVFSLTFREALISS